MTLPRRYSPIVKIETDTNTYPVIGSHTIGVKATHADGSWSIMVLRALDVLRQKGTHYEALLKAANKYAYKIHLAQGKIRVQREQKARAAKRRRRSRP